MRCSRVVAAALMAFTLAGCGDAPGTSPSGVLPTGTAGTRRPEGVGSSTLPCPESGILLWVTEPSAAMGLRSMSVQLYNCADRPLKLKGHPEVTLLDRHLKPIKVTVGHDPAAVAQSRPGDVSKTEVELAPTETASADLVWRDPATRHPARAVTASVLEIAPSPAIPAERLPDVTIDLGATRKVRIGEWKKIRGAGGVEAGDNAPHYGDNHAYLGRLELSTAARAGAAAAVRRIRPALDALRVNGGATVQSVQAALLHLGFDPQTTSAYAAPTPPDIAFEVYPGRGACIDGSVRRDTVTMKVGGVRVEGGCAEP